MTSTLRQGIRLSRSRQGPAVVGFTLVELLVTIAVAAILLAAALPNFREMGLRSRVTQAANQLAADLAYARSEAVKRAVRVAVQRAGSSWADGWQVALDTNGDGVFDAKDDPPLQKREKLAEGFILKAGLASDGTDEAQIVFSVLGGVVDPGAMQFAVCRPDKRADQARLIDVQSSGIVSARQGIGSAKVGC